MADGDRFYEFLLELERGGFEEWTGWLAFALVVSSYDQWIENNSRNAEIEARLSLAYDSVGKREVDMLNLWIANWIRPQDNEEDDDGFNASPFLRRLYEAKGLREAIERHRKDCGF